MDGRNGSHGLVNRDGPGGDALNPMQGQIAALSDGQAAVVGLIDALAGAVTVIRDGERLPVEAGFQLLPGDQIETAADAEATILLADGTEIRLGFDALLTLTTFAWDAEARDGAIKLFMERGGFWIKTGAIAEVNPDGLVVETPVGLLQAWGATVLGRVAPPGETSYFTLLANEGGELGIAQFTNGGGRQLLTLDGHTLAVEDATRPLDAPVQLTANDLGLLYGGAFGNFADFKLPEPAAGEEPLLSEGGQLFNASLTGIDLTSGPESTLR